MLVNLSPCRDVIFLILLGLFSRDTIDICFGDVPAKKRENRTINNQMQCRVRYKVTTTFLPIENQLDFDAKIVIGRLTIDIPYSWIVVFLTFTLRTPSSFLL